MPPLPAPVRSATIAAVLLAVLAGCHPARLGVPGEGPSRTVLSAEDTAAVRAGVRATLEAQVEAWNAGSIQGFMEGYARTDTLTFLSGGSVRQGWQAALDGYLRGYPDRAAMGTLTFSDLTIHPVTADRALVWGRWRLQRAEDAAPGDGPGGLFTLFFARTPGGWRVVHDHTSSD